MTAKSMLKVVSVCVTLLLAVALLVIAVPLLACLAVPALLLLGAVTDCIALLRNAMRPAQAVTVAK